MCIFYVVGYVFILVILSVINISSKKFILRYIDIIKDIVLK